MPTGRYEPERRQLPVTVSKQLSSHSSVPWQTRAQLSDLSEPMPAQARLGVIGELWPRALSAENCRVTAAETATRQLQAIVALVKLVAPAVRDPFATLGDFPRSVDLENLDVDNAGSDQNVNAADDLEESTDPSGERYWRQLEALGRRQMAESVEFQRQLLAEVLNYWLDLAGVRPRLDWSAAKPAVQLGGHGLIGALAVQLLFDCSRTNGLAVCTSCGTPFLPGPRRPRRDRNIYCSDCGLKAATRDASARYRQTKKYRATYNNWQDQRRSQ
jgi:DNA-directed RNA polymerase subunit RPC12/RpoP